MVSYLLRVPAGFFAAINEVLLTVSGGVAIQDGADP